MISIDVVVATYNRQQLLTRTLESLLAAPVPSNVNRRVIVVDNNSTDSTARVVEAFRPRFAGALRYLFEPRSGRSYALNAGIEAGCGDIIAMIDDDEEVDGDYFAALQRAFGSGTLDFAGGPMLPRWGAAIPDWLPPSQPGVIGWIDAGKEVIRYGSDFPGMLVGGNAVLTRRIINRVGPYATHLGRNSTHLMAGEDLEMYNRLLATGAYGLYLPDLIVYHYVPPERLTRKYYRTWAFWRGVSGGIMDRDIREPVTYLAGLPRYRIGAAVRALPNAVAGVCGVARDRRRSVNDLMTVLDLAGFAVGRFLYPVGARRRNGGSA